MIVFFNCNLLFLHIVTTVTKGSLLMVLYKFTGIMIGPIGHVVVKIEEIMLSLFVVLGNGHIVAVFVGKIFVPMF